jgi:hypothetical protein
MGYTVELMDDALYCKSREDAEKAAQIVPTHDDMCPYSLEVQARDIREGPEAGQWYLEITHFQGDHWHNDLAEALWLALAPHLADCSTIEFLGEGGERWRVRWHEGRAYEEYVTAVTWEVNQEITLKEEEAP